MNWISGSDPTYGELDLSGQVQNPYANMSWDRFAGNPEFLRSVGYTGTNPWVGDSGDSGGSFSLDPELMRLIQESGYEQRVLPLQGGEIYSAFKDGKEVNPALRMVNEYDEGPAWNLGFSLASMALAPGGMIAGPQSGIAGGFGLGSSATQGLNAAFNSSLIGAGSGAEDRDILNGAALSGGAPFLPNMGEMVGIDNPYLANAFDGSLKGAAIADLTDNDVTTGAVMGGLPGLGSYLGGRFMDTSYVPTSSGQNLINETNMQSRVRTPMSDMFSPQPQMSRMPEYVPQGSPLAFTESREQRGGFEMPDLNNFFGKLVPSSPQQWGSLAEGLGGLLMGGLQYRRARKLEKEMGARRGAYEGNLRRQLERRDAASGRRSNYAGRETQLQASLAELDSRNMPAMMALNNSQFGGLANMFQSGLRYAGKSGLFGEQYTPGYREPLPPSSYLMGLGTGAVDNYAEPMSSWANDPRRRNIRLGGI